MNLPKAIEILSEACYGRSICFNADWYEALKLGSESVKRDIRNRLINNHPDQALLPGETKD